MDIANKLQSRRGKPRGIVADPETRQRLQALVARVGWQRSYELLGVGQHPIARILSEPGQTVLRTTLVAVRVALDTLEEASR
jgi:hypothetical protein